MKNYSFFFKIPATPFKAAYTDIFRRAEDPRFKKPEKDEALYKDYFAKCLDGSGVVFIPENCL